MKQILAIAIFALAALTTQAQTTTNIVYTVKVETVTAGVTNSASATLRFDAGGTKSDQLSIDGLAAAFSTYRAGGGNKTFENWIKTDVADRVRAYANAKQAADNAATLAKLTSLLTANADLLSNSDLTSLSAIAAKAP